MLKKLGRTGTLLVIAGALLGAASAAHGQAYCSLRDPFGALQEAFPELDHHRSIVRRIREDHRAEVLDRLSFTVHRNELGTHTLYVAFDSDDRLLGVMHVRTERGRWGLSEIAWTLGPDLRVQKMRFQRSRESGQADIENDAFQDQIRGLEFSQLRSLLDSSGDNLVQGSVDVPDHARPLAASTLRSALKTIAATEIIWGSDLDALRASSDSQ